MMWFEMSKHINDQFKLKKLNYQMKFQEYIKKNHFQI